MEGFGWIPGTVENNNTPGSKPALPHLGWNDIKTTDDRLLRKIDPDAGFYFLHSYYFDVKLPDVSIATTKYFHEFACAVRNENIFGTQFHLKESFKWCSVI